MTPENFIEKDKVYYTGTKYWTAFISSSKLLESLGRQWGGGGGHLVSYSIKNLKPEAQVNLDMSFSIQIKVHTHIYK